MEVYVGEYVGAVCDVLWYVKPMTSARRRDLLMVRA